jgi:hypothetical protein
MRQKPCKGSSSKNYRVALSLMNQDKSRELYFDCVNILILKLTYSVLKFPYIIVIHGY